MGKSTTGKNLAKKLNYNFFDVDELIENKEGMSINLIFQNKSESYFRKIENKYLGEKFVFSPNISLSGVKSILVPFFFNVSATTVI